MIRAAVGFSSERDPVAAATEAGSRARVILGEAVADWCLAFVTSDHREGIEILLAKLAETVGTPYVVGCSARGIIAGEVEVEGGPGLGVLVVSSSRMRATPFLFGNEGELGYGAGARIGERLTTSSGTDDLIMVLPDPFTIRPDRLLLGINETLAGVPIVGGASSSLSGSGPTFQFSGEECREEAVSGLRMGGEFTFRIAVTQGCRDLSAPLQVTGAHENLILEIEGRPAYRVMEEYAPQGLLQQGDTAFHYLFTRFPGEPGDDSSRQGGDLSRNIVTADRDTGVLGLGENVGEGRKVVFAVREADAARKDLLRAAEKLRGGDEDRKYSFGIYFNCLARGRSLYGEKGVDAALLREALPGVPVLGFFCNAEMAPLRGVNRLFTYTGVLVMVGG